MQQISMFELIDTENLLPEQRQKLRRALKRGSGFEGGKDRIKKSSEILSRKEFADFLKKEYGIGGSSFEGGFVDSTSMGIRIYEKGWMNRKEYTWTQIADEILNMISTNSY